MPLSERSAGSFLHLHCLRSRRGGCNYLRQCPFVLSLSRTWLISTARIAWSNQPIRVFNTTLTSWPVYISGVGLARKGKQFQTAGWFSTVAVVSSVLYLLLLLLLFSLSLCCSNELPLFQPKALILPLFFFPHPRDRKEWASGCVVVSCHVG